MPYTLATDSETWLCTLLWATVAFGQIFLGTVKLGRTHLSGPVKFSHTFVLVEASAILAGTLVSASKVWSYTVTGDNKTGTGNLTKEGEIWT